MTDLPPERLKFRVFKLLTRLNYLYGRLPFAPAQWRMEELLWKMQPRDLDRCRVRRGGITWILDLGRGHINKDIFYKGVFEPESTASVLAMCRADWVCLDVGANIGYYTLTLARKARAGRVIAFEPTRYFMSSLAANVAANGYDNVTLVRAALADRRQNTTVHIGATTASIVMDEGQDATTEEIECIPLDEYIVQNPLERLDFVKLDVDGYEPYFLKGAEQALQRFHPAILMEVCPDALAAAKFTADEMLLPLQRMGYRFLSVDLKSEFRSAKEIVASIGEGMSSSINIVCLR